MGPKRAALMAQVDLTDPDGVIPITQAELATVVVDAVQLASGLPADEGDTSAQATLQALEEEGVGLMRLVSAVRQIPASSKRDLGYNKQLGSAISVLMACGMDIKQVAGVLRVPEDALWRHYQSEIENGKALAEGAVALRMYDMATGESNEYAFKAGSFFLRTIGGWSEKSNITVDGKLELGPIQRIEGDDDL